MELYSLLNLVAELPENTTYKYVRGTDTCKFINVDVPGQRIFSETSTGESKSWAPSYLEDLAPKIKENVPFNLSGLLNNKGSYRPILETIIAHTREFYTVKKGTATLLVWIPSKPKLHLQLEEIPKEEIPVPVLTSDEEEVLSTPELVDKFRESFIRYWKIVDQHGAQFEVYVQTFESVMNKILANLDMGLSTIFEITDFRQYCRILDRIIQKNPSMGFIKDDKGPNGLEYRVWSTNRHLKDYLEILSISKFLSQPKKADKTEISQITAMSNHKNSYLAALRTKPFLLLAGISGTGKSRIVRKLAQATVPKDLQTSFDGKNRTTDEFKEERWTLQRPANFELIQVKPNWHNSMDVVGYLSNIPSPHYVFTPFINFIVRAMCHPEVPFFLCLDEMNLAPVEEYFAEFLSAIESRAKDKDGNYTTDPIIPPFKTYGDVKDEKDKKSNVGEDMLNIVSSIIKNEMISDEKRNEIWLHLEDKGVTLPKNLIIVGTVNMDETTFSFSRKVLDRAMSIEMNNVDYSSFLFDTTDDDIKAIAKVYEVDTDSTGDNNQLNQLLVDRHIEAKEVVEDLGGAADGSDARFVIDYLETINKLLDGTPFKLGYRAANEALIYLKSSMDFGNLDRNGAMDKFTLMKILSRIEGDESKLRLTKEDSVRLDGCGVDYGKISQERGGATVLSAMKEIILNKLGVKEAENLEDNIEDAEIEGEETTAPAKKEELASLESIKKLDSMIAQLDRDHFVTYWS
ncbi:MAG: hypothetical protein K2K75_02125 [Muribaculaceae bacterium]|nr:hypothetical protein [Muribaculaceae bacterium]